MRSLLIEAVGVKISKLSMLRYIEFNDTLTFKGLTRLLIKLKTSDTVIHVDKVFEEILRDLKTRSLRNNANK